MLHSHSGGHSAVTVKEKCTHNILWPLYALGFYQSLSGTTRKFSAAKSPKILAVYARCMYFIHYVMVIVSQGHIMLIAIKTLCNL